MRLDARVKPTDEPEEFVIEFVGPGMATRSAITPRNCDGDAEQIQLRSLGSRRKAVMEHDLNLGSLSEVLGTNSGRRDHTQRLCIPAAIVIEPGEWPPRNAERLPGPGINRFPVDRPCQHSVDTIDCLAKWRCPVR